MSEKTWNREHWERDHSEWADEQIACLPGVIRENIREDFYGRIEEALQESATESRSSGIVEADMDLFLLANECSRRPENLEELGRLLSDRKTLKAALEIIAVIH